MKEVKGLTFRHALDFSLSGDQVCPKVIGSEEAWKVCPGVYVVFEDSQLVYIGSYNYGMRYRWIRKREGEVYHFKRPNVMGSLKNGKTVKLFAEDEAKLKEQLSQQDNPWVNAAGIEAYLVGGCGFELPWNKKGKKKGKKKNRA